MNAEQIFPQTRRADDPSSSRLVVDDSWTAREEDVAEPTNTDATLAIDCYIKKKKKVYQSRARSTAIYVCVHPVASGHISAFAKVHWAVVPVEQITFIARRSSAHLSSFINFSYPLSRTRASDEKCPDTRKSSDSPETRQ